MWQKLNRVDPRYLFLLFFLGVLSDAFFFGMYMKKPLFLIMAILGALGTDVVLNFLRHKKFIFPLSGLVSSCGSFILISSPHPWAYFVMGATSIWSKHFITFKNRHIFNPVNFGALMCLIYLQEFMQNGGATWSGQFFMLPYLITVGLFLVYRANSLALCLTYLGTFFLIDRFFLSEFLPVNIASFAAPPFMLFIFFMISDPRTTPRKWKQQLAFGAAIALLEAYFKFQKVPNGGIIALAVLSLWVNFLFPLVAELIKNRLLNKFSPST